MILNRPKLKQEVLIVDKIDDRREAELLADEVSDMSFEKRDGLGHKAAEYSASAAIYAMVVGAELDRRIANTAEATKGALQTGAKLAEQMTAASVVVVGTGVRRLLWPNGKRSLDLDEEPPLQEAPQQPNKVIVRPSERENLAALNDELTGQKRPQVLFNYASATAYLIIAHLQKLGINNPEARKERFKREVTQETELDEAGAEHLMRQVEPILGIKEPILGWEDTDNTSPNT